MIGLPPIPQALVPNQARVLTVSSKDGDLLLSLEFAGSVFKAFKEYRTIVLAAPFELLHDDFEGFEAELYIQDGDRMGTISIRKTECVGSTNVRIALFPPAP